MAFCSSLYSFYGQHFFIWLAYLKVASFILVLVAKRSPICLDSNKKYTILYLVFLNNQLLLFDIPTWRSLDMMIIQRFPHLFYYYMWLKLLRSWVNIKIFLVKVRKIRRSPKILGLSNGLQVQVQLKRFKNHKK